VCIAVCDGLKGLPEAITTVWGQTQVQTCVVHLIRNTFRYAARQDWDAIARDLKPIYTAVRTPSRPSGSRSSPSTGERSTRPRSSCGAQPGRSSSRSWTTTWRSARSSARPTRSSPSTPATAGRAGPRALPQRGRRPEVPLPRHPVTGPHGARQGTIGHPMEGRTQRVRHHLRGAHQPLQPVRTPGPRPPFV